MLQGLLAWCVGAVVVGGLACLSASGAEPEPIFSQFQAWAERYLKASDADTRKTLEKEGETLAVKRRAAMTKLIPAVPKRALELALSNTMRRQLPPSITNQLEQRFSGRGDFNVLIADDFARGKSDIQRTVWIGGQTYRAFVYGRRSHQVSQQNATLHGIILDDLMAVHESNVRNLEPGETVDPQTPLGNPDLRCPVCRQPASREVAVEAAGAVYYLDRADHITEFVKRFN